MAEEEAARGGATHATYRGELAPFTESYYFENGGFFALKMAAVLSALIRVEDGELYLS